MYGPGNEGTMNKHSSKKVNSLNWSFDFKQCREVSESLYLYVNLHSICLPVLNQCGVAWQSLTALGDHWCVRDLHFNEEKKEINKAYGHAKLDEAVKYRAMKILYNVLCGKKGFLLNLGLLVSVN